MGHVSRQLVVYRASLPTAVWADVHGLEAIGPGRVRHPQGGEPRIVRFEISSIPRPTAGQRSSTRGFRIDRGAERERGILSVPPSTIASARRSKLEVVTVTTAPTIGTRSPQLGRPHPPVLRRTVVSEI